MVDTAETGDRGDLRFECQPFFDVTEGLYPFCSASESISLEPSMTVGAKPGISRRKLMALTALRARCSNCGHGRGVC
jgi:hypothetical protein